MAAIKKLEPVAALEMLSVLIGENVKFNLA
jgi:hypothetical protein